MYGMQCLECGRLVGHWISKARVAGRQTQPWDMEREADWGKGEGAYAMQYRTWRIEQDGLLRTKRESKQDIAASQKERWWAEYSAYLKSPEWREKRMRVLDRASGICEGCGVSAANEVHHLTYDRAGKEMLFDLVALCAECHHSIHGEAHADIR